MGKHILSNTYVFNDIPQKSKSQPLAIATIPIVTAHPIKVENEKIPAHVHCTILVTRVTIPSER